MPIMDKNLEKLVKDNLKTLNENIKDVKENKDNTFDVIASTEDVDRDGEIIKVDGWETENWLKNPVVLANHYYTIENISGKGTEFYRDEEGRMRLKGVFSNNEMGKMAKELYNGGFLKAVSVGFIVKQRNETDRLIIEKAELLEVSFVAVPCNAEAISMDGKLFKKGIKAGLLKEIKKEDENKETLEQNNTIGNKLTNLIVGSETLKDTERVWICGIYTDKFVFNIYNIKDGVSKFYKRGYKIDGKDLSLVGDKVEVVEQIEWAEKGFEKKLEVMKLAFDEKINNIESVIKTMSDDKDKTDDSKTDKEVLNNFFKNLSKNVSNSLYQMKKGDK